MPPGKGPLDRGVSLRKNRGEHRPPESRSLAWQQDTGLGNSVRARGPALARPPLMSLDKAPLPPGLGSVTRALWVHSPAAFGAGELGANAPPPLPVSVTLDQTPEVTVPLLPRL